MPASYFSRDTAHAGGGTAMQMRVFGRTGMQLSVLGFGCGAVGGLMVRGDPLDQERTIARAIASGVNYFDTAVQYGNGESEKNIGRILQKLKPANVVVGTKVRLPLKNLWLCGRPLFGRFGVESGHHRLVMSISAFDPNRTSIAVKPSAQVSSVC
jgi:aryl-alcohol dehydrogenase-like predicted oxidoreductase